MNSALPGEAFNLGYFNISYLVAPKTVLMIVPEFRDQHNPVQDNDIVEVIIFGQVGLHASSVA
ncbi:MAG: hypothetical protein IIC09_04365 [Proteobacteria bacterium]|nr:hypothetical protein [Pseudomonadota bacterium]